VVLRYAAIFHCNRVAGLRLDLPHVGCPGHTDLVHPIHHARAGSADIWVSREGIGLFGEAFATADAGTGSHGQLAAELWFHK